jgi:hypothetical protein
LALFLGLAGCAIKPTAPAPKTGSEIVPPRMTKRAIAKPAQDPPGEQVQISDHGNSFTLFVPAEYQPKSGDIELALHFHGAAWFAIQEHLRAGRTTPLLSIYLGEGSMLYRNGFQDPQRLPRVLKTVAEEIRLRAGKRIRITSLDVSSYSAGYGAVRELVKSPDNVKLIRRIVLADSMYASYGPNQKPDDEHIDVWLPFAEAAMNGNKVFVFTYSQVPTTGYASSSECARALCLKLGVPLRKLVYNANQARTAGDYPLVERADQGHLHVWGYWGTDADAHMAHPRHLADIWKAL